jgi:hypothetical protein
MEWRLLEIAWNTRGAREREICAGRRRRPVDEEVELRRRHATLREG